MKNPKALNSPPTGQVDMPFIRSVFSRGPQDEGLSCSGPDLTQQHFKDESDVNNIIAKYQRTGLLTDPLKPSTRQPRFGDFSDLPDYQSALAMVEEVDDAFMELPASVRKRFDNDPVKVAEFLSDPSNRDEAIKLGLVTPPPPIQDSVSEGLGTVTT